MRTMQMIWAAIAMAAADRRAWILGWLLVALPALLLVAPVYVGLAGALDHQPAAAYGLDMALDRDLARTAPDLRWGGYAAIAVVVLGWTFLCGGILTTPRGVRRSHSEFFAACGHCFLRNLRVTGVGLVLALLLGWGVAFVDGWLRHDVFADADPGRGLVPGLSWRALTVGAALEASRWVHGFLFLMLVFVAKVARAHLCVRDRHGATAAWVRALLQALRRPLRLGLMTGAFALAVLVLQVATGFVLGLGTQPADLWWQAIAAVTHTVLMQVLMVALVYAARSFAGVEPTAPEPLLLTETTTVEPPPPPAEPALSLESGPPPQSG